MFVILIDSFWKTRSNFPRPVAPDVNVTSINKSDLSLCLLLITSAVGVSSTGSALEVPETDVGSVGALFDTDSGSSEIVFPQNFVNWKQSCYIKKKNLRTFNQI